MRGRQNLHYQDCKENCLSSTSSILSSFAQPSSQDLIDVKACKPSLVESSNRSRANPLRHIDNIMHILHSEEEPSSSASRDRGLSLHGRDIQTAHTMTMSEHPSSLSTYFQRQSYDNDNDNDIPHSLPLLNRESRKSSLYMPITMESADNSYEAEGRHEEDGDSQDTEVLLQSYSSYSSASGEESSQFRGKLLNFDVSEKERQRRTRELWSANNYFKVTPKNYYQTNNEMREWEETDGEGLQNEPNSPLRNPNLLNASPTFRMPSQYSDPFCLPSVPSPPNKHVFSQDSQITSACRPEFKTSQGIELSSPERRVANLSKNASQASNSFITSMVTSKDLMTSKGIPTSKDNQPSSKDQEISNPQRNMVRESFEKTSGNSRVLLSTPKRRGDLTSSSKRRPNSKSRNHQNQLSAASRGSSFYSRPLLSSSKYSSILQDPQTASLASASTSDQRPRKEPPVPISMPRK